MNFFASSEYLDILGKVYFPAARTRPCDVALDGKVIRCLEADGRLVASSTFLDYHLPLREDETRGAESRKVHAPWVAGETIEIERFDGSVSDEFNIAPFIDWSLFPTFDDYLQMVRRRPHMKEYERRRRKFAQAHGELAFAYRDKAEDVLPLARSWKTQQLKQTGLPDWFATPENVAFFDVMAARGLLVASTLRWGGRLLAAFIGVECDRRLSGWLFTYTPEPDLRKYSVGHQLLLCLLEYSHAHGHTEFDFSIGPDPYKLGYATHARVLRPLGPRPLPQALVRGTKKRAKAILVRAPALYEAVRGCKNLLKQTVVSRGLARDIETVPDEAPAAPLVPPAPAPEPAVAPVPPKAEDRPATVDPHLAATIEEKLAARKAARLAKDFAGSDRIRDELAELGVKVRDGKDPTTGEPVMHWEFVGAAPSPPPEQVRQQA